MEYGKTLICPKCGKKFTKSEENKAFLPFCSKKCKMVDLGKWLGEKYVVEGTESPPNKKTENDE
jgi:endogenous inhibitor of DNA gyrase (YacG/DUF329 family)